MLEFNPINKCFLQLGVFPMDAFIGDVITIFHPALIGGGDKESFLRGQKRLDGLGTQCLDEWIQKSGEL
ncbi:hypothetical protein [Rhizobium phaseoli]|nr:hypothetical protein [Rhizobium phaseoli]